MGDEIPVIPRRNRIDLMQTPELLIYNAMLEIEDMEADVGLTEAVMLLKKARDLVSDYIDANIEKFNL
jgi:hypothetical protein